MARLHPEPITVLDGRIGELDKTLRTVAGESDRTARLQTMPGIGLITARAIESFATPMASFQRGRDVAARLGPVPLQRSTGGKPRLGKTSKMGQRDIRRLNRTGFSGGPDFWKDGVHDEQG
jgi:transposase